MYEKKQQWTLVHTWHRIRSSFAVRQMGPSIQNEMVDSIWLGRAWTFCLDTLGVKQMNEKMIGLTEKQFEWFKSLALRACAFALQEEDVATPGSQDEENWIEIKKVILEMEVENVGAIIQTGLAPLPPDCDNSAN